MTPERWQRIKGLSQALLDSPEDQRDVRLASLCDGDAELEREIRALLAAVHKADGLFEASPISQTTAAGAVESAMHWPALPAGARVGAYRIVREIGRGGMGTVYLAERADNEYMQRVALKLAELRSDAVLKWFRDERQTLATLEHPNIARLMDGGTTPDGIPYLVMEFVDGPPIDEYCETHQLTVERRLRMFQQVCAAVDLAHRHLVVHRDLKPRNILVADDVPKLLDFGIATLIDGSGDRRVTDERLESAFLMTPLYASPEQLNGDPITTATDVYSLGVLLYKLLTDQSPYTLTGKRRGELARAIREQEPVRPSLRTPVAWRRQVAGDLDAILLKAMRKDPRERYGSAAAMAADIDRYLSRRPVEARGDHLGYRIGKFVRRNAAATVASILVTIALVTALGAALWEQRQTERERQRAERHFDGVRQLASSLIFEVHDRIQELPGSVPARQLLVSRALQYFDGLAAEERDNLPLQRELASAYDRLGAVLGRPFRSNLGDTTAALASYRKALAIRQRIVQALPRDRQAQLDLWSSYHVLGDMLRETAGTRDALEAGAKAAEISAALQRQWPDDPEVLKAAARTEVMRQRTFLQSGAIEPMRYSAELALKIEERLLVSQPDSRELKDDIASLHGRLAIALLKLGDAAAALPHAQQRVAMAKLEGPTGAGEPVQVRRARSSALLQLAQVLTRAGDPAAAEVAQAESLALRRGLAAEDPNDRQSIIDLMDAQLEIGELLLRRHDYRTAVPALREAVTLAGQLNSADPQHVFIRLSLVSGLVRLSSALLVTDRSRSLEAAQFTDRAMALAEAASQKDPDDVRFRFELSQAYALKGDLAGEHRFAESDDAASSWYEKSLAIVTELRDSGRLAGGTLNGDEPAKVAEIENKVHGRGLDVSNRK